MLIYCLWIFVYVIKIILHLAKTSRRTKIILGIAVNDLRNICTLIAVVFTIVGFSITAYFGSSMFSSKGIALALGLSALFSLYLKLRDLFYNFNWKLFERFGFIISVPQLQALTWRDPAGSGRGWFEGLRYGFS